MFLRDFLGFCRLPSVESGGVPSDWDSDEILLMRPDRLESRRPANKTTNDFLFFS